MSPYPRSSLRKSLTFSSIVNVVLSMPERLRSCPLWVRERTEFKGLLYLYRLLSQGRLLTDAS
jgi:hypothetical protein